jgi:AcrR family transcriptional regulator
MSRSLDEKGHLTPIGRPREFDASEAIDKAMLVFWRKGYEGTSIADLTEALGITRPSLYAAFGNKEQLFRTVLDRYDEGTAEFLSPSLNLSTARDVAEGLLRGAANFHARPANPPGCLMVHGALVGSDESDPLRQETRNRRARLREAIRKRLERALVEGDLPEGAEPGALARYIVAVMRGMAVEAASGAKGSDLHQIVDLAMRAWPASKRRVPPSMNQSLRDWCESRQSPLAHCRR